MMMYLGKYAFTLEGMTVCLSNKLRGYLKQQ